MTDEKETRRFTNSQLTTIASIAVFIVGVLWFIAEPGFEPLTIILPALIVGVGSYFVSNEQEPPKSNEETFLELVEIIWIKGFLEPSLGKNDRNLAPNITLEPDLVLRRTDLDDFKLGGVQHIRQTYEQMRKRLLILGDPGSGKTILLLQLAKQLIEQLQDEDLTNPETRLPVVLSLYSWAKDQLPFEEWLIEEIQRQYQPNKIIEEWVKNDRFALLLDGLDEVKEDHRDACIQAINTYHQARPLVPIVVCSRTAEYEALSNRLDVRSAIMIQSLTDEQARQYLQGDALKGIRHTLGKDAELNRMTKNPFLVNAVANAYYGQSEFEIRLPDDEKDKPVPRFRDVMNTYTDHLLRKDTTWNNPDARRYLTWLARIMIQTDQSVFYISDLQPRWLIEDQHRQYKTKVRLWDGGVYRLPVNDELDFKTQKSISFHRFLPQALNSIRQNLFDGLLMGLVAGLLGWQIYGLVGGVIYGLVGGLWSMLSIESNRGLFVRLSVVPSVIETIWSNTSQLHTQINPYQSIKNKLNQAILENLFLGLFYGLLVSLFVGLFFGLAGLVVGLIYALIFGLVGGLTDGKYLHHHALRKTFAQHKIIPYDFVGFLQDMSKAHIIRQVGGGFAFRHDFMRQYFAENWDRIDEMLSKK